MSRTPEGSVKDYLKVRAEALGGEAIFVRYIGRRNCPDIRLRFKPEAAWPRAFGKQLRNCWVETKAKNGVLSSGQEREIKRMREHGEIVLVLLSKEDIDREFPL